MTENRYATLGQPGMRTGDRSGGGRDPDYEQPIDNTRSRMRRRAVEALWLALGIPLLLGPWVLVVYVPLVIERGGRAVIDWLDLDTDIDRASLVCFGVLAALMVALVPDWALLWWPFPWQRMRASWRGLLWPARWPGIVALVIFLRCLPVLVSLKMWPEVWYLDQRQRQETVDPTRSSMAYDTVEPHRVRYPGIHNPYTDPETPHDTDPGPRSYGDIIIDGVPIEAQAARIVASDPVSGEPSVAVGGNGGNGHHTAQARIPTSLLGGDRQHVVGLLRILHDVYGALAGGEQLSRSNLRRHGLSNNQARDLSAWFREQGYATMDRANQHELTAEGERYLDVALAGLTEARRRIE